jgi:hypothetical protein
VEARMMDGLRFTTMDPLAEKYYSVSPYAYCMGNPINRLDPNGMASFYNWETGRYEDGHGNEVSWEDVQQEYGIGTYQNGDEKQQTSQANQSQTAQSSNSITPWGIGWEWLTGTGPRERFFTNGDYFTELLRKHEHIENVRVEIIRALREGTYKPGLKPYSLSGFGGVGKFIKDYSALITFGLTGNLAVTYLGSYRLSHKLITIDKGKGTAIIMFTVTNSSTIESGTRPPVFGYTEFWRNTAGKSMNSFFETGPMSKTTQIFQWEETLKF